MNSLDDFVELVRNELGLPITTETVGLTFDRLGGWDSMHLLTLLAVLERHTDRRISLPDLLQAPSLEHVYRLTEAR